MGTRTHPGPALLSLAMSASTCWSIPMGTCHTLHFHSLCTWVAVRQAMESREAVIREKMEARKKKMAEESEARAAAQRARVEAAKERDEVRW
jgi:hypothetical protein